MKLLNAAVLKYRDRTEIYMRAKIVYKKKIVTVWLRARTSIFSESI